MHKTALLRNLLGSVGIRGSGVSECNQKIKYLRILLLCFIVYEFLEFSSWDHTSHRIYNFPRASTADLRTYRIHNWPSHSSGG
jgi:hypothetical protein